MRLSFQKVSVCNSEKQKDHAEEINDVPCINHSAANAAIMKIDTDHFKIIIGVSTKRRQKTDGTETIIKKCTGNKT